jgi:hypothetical protein
MAMLSPRPLRDAILPPPAPPVQSPATWDEGFIPPPSSALLPHPWPSLYKSQGRTQTIATVDQDATIVESHKAAARPHYDGGRGYRPMLAVWAEADLILADEFRDGNVPARQAPLTCARRAFEALPKSVVSRFFRGDSACHEAGLVEWLSARMLKVWRVFDLPTHATASTPFRHRPR